MANNERRVSDIKQDFVEYVQQYPAPDDNQIWDLWALDRAWNEYKRLESTQNV